MNRSGYVEGDDFDQWANIRWRGAVASSIRGKRGQAFLREMIAALDAMPEKRLITNDLERDGNVCAIGSVGKARGLDMSVIDPENYEGIAAAFGIASPLVQEIEWANDEGGWDDTAEKRWQRMRDWAESQLAERSR